MLVIAVSEDVANLRAGIIHKLDRGLDILVAHGQLVAEATHVIRRMNDAHLLHIHSELANNQLVTPANIFLGGISYRHDLIEGTRQAHLSNQ